MKVKIKFILLLVLVAGLVWVYIDFKNGNKKIRLYREHDMAKAWMKNSVRNYLWEYGKYPDGFKPVLTLVDSLDNRQYATAKDFFADLFSEGNLKIIKVKDKSEEIGVLILSAGYGGEFANDISEFDIADKDKLRLYKSKDHGAFGYLGGFRDYLLRDKDLFVAYYNRRLEELSNRGRHAKGAKKMMDIHGSKKGKSYFFVSLRAVVESVDLQKNELCVVSDSVKFYCHHLNNLTSLKVNDTINLSGYTNESKYPEYHLDRCLLWDFELNRDNVKPYLEKYFREF